MGSIFLMLQKNVPSDTSFGMNGRIDCEITSSSPIWSDYPWIKRWVCINGMNFIHNRPFYKLEDKLILICEKFYWNELIQLEKFYFHSSIRWWNNFYLKIVSSFFFFFESQYSCVSFFKKYNWKNLSIVIKEMETFSEDAVKVRHSTFLVVYFAEMLVEMNSTGECEKTISLWALISENNTQLQYKISNNINQGGIRIIFFDGRC